MNIKLSERMEAIAEMVTPGSRLADVGCDHAFLPIELCRTGRIPSAVAMDVKPGPLERAKEHIAAYGLDDRIAARLSDGMEQLGEDEADAVLIAGMGGLLIARILTERAIPESVTELILAPQSEFADVRRCVRRIGFVITDENMVLEDEKFYPIIKTARDIPQRGASPGRAGSGSDAVGRQELEDNFGPILLARRNPVLHKWLERALTVTDDILSGLGDVTQRLPDHDNLRERKKELEYKRELLITALDLYQ